jgi:hypothetical protein
LQGDERISRLLASLGDGIPALPLVGRRSEGSLRLHVRDRVRDLPGLRLDASDPTGLLINFRVQN